MSYFFAAIPRSTSRRMASERFGMSGCFLRQASTFARRSSEATSWMRGAINLPMRTILAMAIGRVKRNVWLARTMCMLYSVVTIRNQTGAQA